MKKEIFKQLIVDSLEASYLHLSDRDLSVPEHSMITAIVGPRRSGKTSFLLRHLTRMREIYGKQRCFYINFEDDRLYPLQLPDLRELMDAYYELFPDHKSQTVYVYFDEIQVVAGWEEFVRRIHDTENIRIFISGSSSKMLSSEIATALRGRSLTFEIFPLSFKEYLRFLNIDTNPYSSKQAPYIVNALQDYLRTGGFPELIRQPKELWLHMLNDYFNLAVYRDLIQRFNITNQHLLKAFLHQCVKNPATMLSMNKTFSAFKSQGISVSKNTLYEYFGYFQENYTLFAIPVYRNSIREQQVNPRKIYVVDNGFYAIHQYKPDTGKQYENTVFMHLRRKSNNIFYFKGSKEVDFLIESQTGIQLINVCYDLSDAETFKRETTGLFEAMKELNTRESVIITGNVENRIEAPEGTIHLIPLVKWLLS